MGICKRYNSGLGPIGKEMEYFLERNTRKPIIAIIQRVIPRVVRRMIFFIFIFVFFLLCKRQKQFMFILENRSHEKRVGAKALLFLIFFNFTNKRLFFFFFR